MPFPKIRLKKSKQQYNVASKSAYVITVELLDSATVECTLTAESTGKNVVSLLLSECNFDCKRLLIANQILMYIKITITYFVIKTKLICNIRKSKFLLKIPMSDTNISTKKWIRGLQVENPFINDYLIGAYIIASILRVSYPELTYHPNIPPGGLPHSAFQGFRGQVSKQK